MDKILFPATIMTDGCDEDDSTDEDADTDEDEDEDKDMGEDSSADSDEDVYEEENEWGTLYTDETNGIYKKIVDAVGKQSAKILHDFAITAWASSIKSDNIKDVKVHMTGYHQTTIERCIRCLFAHDIDGQEDGDIDLNVDKFWDEFSNFQNR